ncbi:MAG TPA: glycosyltransferase family 2 protein, partial [Candidatus Kryptonia bacterium]|nr:glycosyltransferase family 2 protein [Candidatus Kryptonia bacterium]
MSPSTPQRPLATAVLIPAFNCERTIGEVVRGARRFVTTVLVVNDGSGDATAARATEAGAEVETHRTNQGKGAALLTGMRHLENHGIERVLTMDGDGQHLGEEIPRLLGAANAESDALILGARQFDAVSIAPMKLFGNRFANRWVEIA